MLLKFQKLLSDLSIKIFRPPVSKIKFKNRFPNKILTASRFQGRGLTRRIVSLNCYESQYVDPLVLKKTPRWLS